MEQRIGFALYPQPLEERAAWKLNASHNGQEGVKSIDGELATCCGALETNGEAGVIDYLFAKPTQAKSIRISQLGEAKGTFWSIHELEVLGAVKK